ncbi:MAG: helix-turn-helix transcriptional regulator, partial [Gammaproteobacteria bacterium]|nr:helix-turn-helix transcriptional regulator [Gammaproteobacteria bacterium]
TSLATRFRAIVGASVQQYITRVRVNLAASLLENPNRPSVAAVAERVGYRSETAFSRAFTREMGVTPAKLARIGN